MPMMNSVAGWLIPSTLLFTTTAYYLLKNYLVEWGCRKFLKGRVRLYSDDTEKTNGAIPNGHAHVANGVAKFPKENSSLTVLSRGDLAEVAQLMVSQLITAATAVVSAVSMWQAREDCVYSKSPLLVTFVHIPAWYLFYDFFAMFDSFTLRKNLRHLSLAKQVKQYIIKKSGLVCHHLILFFGGYVLVADYSVRGDKGDFIIAWFWTMEFTNPFLSMAIILKILGLAKTTLYTVNGIILLLFFFVFRILNYPIAVLIYAAQYHGWNIWSALNGLYPMCHIFSAIQFSFQAFWFYQITRLGAKALLSKKTS